MPEDQNPLPSDPPQNSSPDESAAEEPSTSNEKDPDNGDAATETVEPAAAAYTTRAERAAGRRVTRRTSDRREVTEHTQETITEDIPLEAYQGPGSTHPAPVG